MALTAYRWLLCLYPGSYRDEFGDEWRLGGSGLYCAATAARLQRAATLVTRIGERERPALERRCSELGIALRCLPSNATTRVLG